MNNQGFQPNWNNGNAGNNQGFQPNWNNGNSNQGFQPNYQTNQTNWNNQGMNTNSNSKPPKRKHGCLTFLLTVICIVGLGFGVVKLCDIKAAKNMEHFHEYALENPIELYDTDTNNNVTQNFLCTTNYTVESGGKSKTYKVKWESNKKLVSIDKDGNAEVKTPENKSENIILTETYKWLLGKATKSYTLTITTNKVQDIEDFKVVSVESVKNGSYNREMEVTTNEQGEVISMYGDFGKNYVYNSGDALNFVYAHRSSIGIPEDREFKIEQVNSTNQLVVYTVRQYIKDTSNNEYEIKNNDITLIVDAKSFEVLNINCDIDRETIKIGSINNSLDCISILEKHTGKTSGVSAVFIKRGSEVYKNKLCDRYSCIYETGEEYSAYIDKTTGDIVDFIQTNLSVKAKDLKGTVVNGSGENEGGEEFEFEVLKTDKTFFKSEKYYLVDTKRNIHSFNSKGSYLIFKMLAGSVERDWVIPSFLLFAPGMVDMWISDALSFYITSDTSVIDNGPAVGGHVNVQKAYDFYMNTLGRKSYDNNGAPILVVSGSTMMTDNASWNNEAQYLAMYEKDVLTKTLADYTEVLGHEITHAVFQSVTNGLSSSDNEDIGGMNESFADIMGILIRGDINNWEVGEITFESNNKTYVMRDIANFNGDHVYGTYPEYYKGENWTGEEHDISVVLSHVAYEMCKSGEFTSDELANIWYTALNLGLSENSTYVTMRQNVIKSLDILGYDKEIQDMTARFFDDRKILDPNYKFTTKGKQVDGDVLLDDNENREYICMLFPIGTLFNNEPIRIYEKNRSLSDSEVLDINNRINKYIDENYNTSDVEADFDGDGTLDYDLNLSIEYKQMSPVVFDFLYDFVYKTKESVRQSAIESGSGSDEEASFIDWLISLFIIVDKVESTPYELFGELMYPATESSNTSN